jgi:hypothetical protein
MWSVQDFELMHSSGSCAVEKRIRIPARDYNTFTSHDPDATKASPRTREPGRRA